MSAKLDATRSRAHVVDPSRYLLVSTTSYMSIYSKSFRVIFGKGEIYRLGKLGENIPSLMPGLAATSN